MALKRINKELTDLGRYVASSSFTALRCVVVRCSHPTMRRGFKTTMRGYTILTDLVTRPRPALLALLERIWYDTPSPSSSLVILGHGIARCGGADTKLQILPCPAIKPHVIGREQYTD